MDGLAHGKRPEVPEVLSAQEGFKPLRHVFHGRCAVGAAAGPKARFDLEAPNLLIHILQLPLLTIVNVLEEDHGGAPAGSLFFNPLSDALSDEERHARNGFLSFNGPFHRVIPFLAMTGPDPGLDADPFDTHHVQPLH